MQAQVFPTGGIVYCREGKRTATWFMRLYLSDGTQTRRKIGPAWKERGRPEAGHYTKKTAEAELRRLLVHAEEGKFTVQTRTGITFAEAVDEYLRYLREERGRKTSYIKSASSVIGNYWLPLFGDKSLDKITTDDIELWKSTKVGKLAPSTINAALVALNGVFKRARKVWKLNTNPVTDVEKPPVRASNDLLVYDDAEIAALVGAAEDQVDAALFFVAAYTGLRQGELLGLRWRDVEFDKKAIRVRGNYTAKEFTTPKNGRIRTVPIRSDVAPILLKLRNSRDYATGMDDLVFTRDGSYLDAPALVKRYRKTQERAGVRPLRFHDLRHVFGTWAAEKAPLPKVQAWMGHADITTTMRYIHAISAADDAELLSDGVESPAAKLLRAA